MVTSQAVYLAFLGCLACERGLELVISRKNAQAAFARGAYEVGRAHYRVMVALHTSFFFACAFEVLRFERPFPGLLGFIALGLVLFAQALRYTAVSALGERWNVRILVWPKALPITTGPYRFVRHPNYVAVVVEIACVPIVHGAFATAVIFTACNAALLAVRIGEEERALGAAYADAFRDRPRLIPRLFGG